MERLNKRDNAKLFDKPIGYIEDALADKLPWLDHIFGRAERLVKMKDGMRYYTPNVYLGRNEYLPLLPDNRKLGNYCFFVLEDPQTVTVPMQSQNRVRSPFSLIVWVDMRNVGDAADDRNTERLKEEVLKTVRVAWIKKGSVTLSRIYERAENVYTGFTVDEVQNQFMMAPYAAFRFEGVVMIDESCY